MDVLCLNIRVERRKTLRKTQEQGQEKGEWVYYMRSYSQYLLSTWMLNSINHYLCNKRMDRYMFYGTVLVIYPNFLLCWVVEESKSCRKGWSWGDMKLLSGFVAWQKSKFPEALKFYRYLSLKVMACRCSEKSKDPNSRD